ncbi:Fc receptor-like protein 5 [Paramisgurnus dabryanus]|uniref:Fc receptor-like protein 5 n=1 Tax=Paramisgurnus dabryanus TaxID=90735 RepID=UPI0031F3E14E
MEMFKILLLTVAVIAAVKSQNAADDPSTKPLLTQTPDVPVIYTGENLTFNCKSEKQSLGWEYLFFRDSEQINTDTSANSFSVTSDSGKYCCQTKKNNFTSGQSDERTVTFKDPPSVKVVSNWTDAFIGETVTLKCEIQDTSEKWMYTWFKDGNIASSGPDTQINGNTPSISVKPNQSGTYTYVCQAELEGRSVKTKESSSHSFKVHDIPIPKLTVDPTWKEFFPNEQITMQCGFGSSSDGWSFEWTKNGKQIITNPTLTIIAKSSSDSGQYACKGKRNGRSVVTQQSDVFQLNVKNSTPEPAIRPNPSFEFFYTGEQVQLTCNMSGAAWEYYWYKDSKQTKPIANKNYIINSTSVHDTGEYHCEAKRGNFFINSGKMKVQVKALSATSLNLVTELSDIIAGNILTLNCKVLDDNTWNYTWFENSQELNESSSTLKVKSTEETIKNEFKCRGKRTERPLYSSLSDPFMVDNILFKRKILLAISGCFVCCFVILIIGCIVLKITRKPEKKEPVREDLFISVADSKNQTASPLTEYMDKKPLEKESEEKEELQLDRISVTHVDGVIKDEDSPSAETSGLTSFK